MNGLDPVVGKALDAICVLGCQQVYVYIDALATEQTRPEYQALDTHQRMLLLRELRSIMAVYERS